MSSLWDEVTSKRRNNQRLTDRERARGTIPPGWEYACRAGTVTAYSFGDEVEKLYRFGNDNDKTGGFPDADKEHDDGKEYSAPVGSYPPNPWARAQRK